MRPPEGDELPAAAALDLGGTSLKAAWLDARGDGIAGVLRAEAPPLVGTGTTREGDALAYAEVADRLLARLTDRMAPVPLGLASQRSTFLVWDRSTRQPLTRMISWQDGRGEAWCAAHPELAAEVFERTGLRLSGYYLGPKLATLLARDRRLRDRLSAGDAVAGTLDTFLLHRWCGVLRTDATIAARTLLFEPRTGDWCDSMLSSFGIPRAGLPRVGATSGFDLDLPRGWRLNASMADQAAAATATLPDRDAALVNMGTGAFVLWPASGGDERRPGFLTGLMDPGGDRREPRFALEGPINGVAGVLGRIGGSSLPPPLDDPAPVAFCMVDSPGLGAPHWRGDLGERWSSGAEKLETSARRRIAIEGLLFRIREILDGLRGAGGPAPVYLSGGLARDPFVADGLAALLRQPVVLAGDSEASALGAARMAAGLRGPARESGTTRVPGPRGAYLVEKYPAWRRWLSTLLEGSPGDQSVAPDTAR